MRDASGKVTRWGVLSAVGRDVRTGSSAPRHPSNGILTNEAGTETYLTGAGVVESLHYWEGLSPSTRRCAEGIIDTGTAPKISSKATPR